jgi:Sulfotransferase domain
MSHRVIFLWTVPRSVSTSFERMMSARGDHTVFDEPFSQAYYYGPDRRSARYDESLPESSAQEILESIEAAAEERPVFVKDMAYQAADLLGPDLLKRFDNCFLVRDPAATLRSLARRWPDFSDDEAGWAALGEAASITESLGQERVVLDADVLCRHPGSVVQEWCERMDLPFDPDALSWEPGMRPEWALWGDWHASTARSTGFSQLDEPPPPPTPDEGRVHEAYQVALPVYRELVADAIGATLLPTGEAGLAATDGSH